MVWVVSQIIRIIVGFNRKRGHGELNRTIENHHQSRHNDFGNELVSGRLTGCSPNDNWISFLF
jgi:hypothetical protein